MADFKPSMPYSTPVQLLVPTYKTVKGVPTKVYPYEGDMLYCSFKTYGGTERTENDVFSVIDTANVETWYRPDIKSDCRIKNMLNGGVYEIKGEPENVNMRNQFCKFKVQRVKGGA